MTKKLSDTIMSAHIIVPGEPDVGIPHVYIDIKELYIDGDTDSRAFARAELERCFSQIYDGRARVIFDDEAPEQHEGDE